MSTLRRLVSSHLFVFMLLGLASVSSAFGQTATLSNNSHAFGNITVGNVSNTFNFTLRNTSTTVALPVNGVSTAGDFSQTNTCGTSVAARGNCVITVTFVPTAVGTRTGSVSISDSLGTQTATLTGTGAVSATVNPATRSFGNVGIGSISAAKVFTVTNRASSPMSFTITPGANASETDNCSSVAGGGTCTINASYAPTAAGAGTGTIGISFNGAGSPLSVTVTGSGVAPASVTPATRAFGNQAAGSPSAARVYTVSNKGTTAMSFTVTPNGPFTETDNCSSVAGGGTCTINGVFAPIAAGAATGGFSISYSGFGSPLSVTATGTGIAPVTMTPATTAFGNVGVSSVSAAKKITVTNKGTTAMAFTIAASTGFTETDNCASVAAGGTCTVNASFAPTAVGAVTGTVSASYDGVGSPLSVTVTGTGIGALTMTPATAAFGNVAQGTTSATKAFTVTNKGTAAQVLDIQVSTGFSQTNTCGASLAGSKTCTVTVAFKPTDLTAVSGTLTVNSASLTAPLSSTLTGTGVLPVTVAPATLAFANQNVLTASAAKSVTITNLATTALPVQSIVVSPADYTQTNNCGTSIRANNSCTINVIFKPATAASIPGTLTISDSAVGSPQIVTLSGTGVFSAVRTITITPATATVAKPLTLQFAATATYTNGTSAVVTTLGTWASANTAFLSIVPNTGLASSVAVGSTNVTLTLPGSTVVGTKAVTVLPPALTAIALSPATAAIDPGATMTYSATGSYADNTTAPMASNTVVWSSDSVAVATINAAGVASGVNGGIANIKAVSGTITSPTVQLTVNGPALKTITIAPAAASFAKGTTQQFTATGTYADATTKDLTTTVVWSSSSANLTISNVAGTQGVATGVTAGTANVNASWNGGAVVGSTTATILTAPLASIALTPASITVGIGAQQQYAAIGTYTDNTTANITSQVTWGTGNTALVGINTTGMATVFGTSDQAVPVTATMGTITSNPPAYVNALSTLPRVCPTADVDMKVLVIDNAAAGYADLPAIKQILDFVGTPYTVMQYTDVTPAVLSDGTCHGYYQAVIMAFGDDIYSGNANLFTTLNSYETTFHVRQLNWFFNPTPDYGFNYSASSVPSTSTYTANFTAAAASIFPNINTTTPLTFSGAFIYLAPAYTPASGNTVTPLLTDASGNVLSAIYTSSTGPEVLSQTFDSNQYLKHNLVLAYGLLNWATKGVFLGDYHVYAAAQVDDFFINDAEWVPGTPCTNAGSHDRTASDDPSLPTFRLKAADMTALTAWQNSLQSDPMFTGFKLTMAFNGVGTVGNKDWTGLPVDGVANDDLVTSLPSYEQFYHWVTHTYDHPNTLNGLHKSDVGGDTDNPQVDSIDLEILTNLFVASGTTQGGMMLDMDPSDTTAPAGVATLNFTDFDPAAMVSPGVTGLNDPVVPQYLYQDGIRYVVSDTSVLTAANNGPNPSPNVGIINSFAPGIYEVPRYPNSIYYNAANWNDIQAEFHCIYGPDPGPAQSPYDTYQAADILNYTTDTFVVNMLKGDMDPQMFHQPNLHAYDGVNSLMSDVYNQTFTKYKALYKLPVLSLTLRQLGDSMQARNAYNLAGATGTIVGVGSATPSVSVTVPAANPGAVISITGLASNGSELYGGTNISHIQINQGQTVTLPLQ